MRAFNFTEVPSIAVANGATTPAPSYASQCLAWSSTLARPVVWDGAAWQRLALLNDSGQFRSTKTGGGASSAFLAEAANPSIGWKIPGGAADSKVWDISIDPTTMWLRLVNDTDTAVTNVLTVARSGMTVGTITFGGTSVVAPQFRVDTAGSGIVYFGTGTNNYLYWNGSTYSFGPGGVVNATVNASADASANVSFMAANVGGANGAMIGFLRQGAYGIKMGLDTNNSFLIGGFSQGNNALRVYWDTGGNQVTTGTVTQNSDIRFKRAMIPISDIATKLLKVDSFTYTDTVSNQRRIGVSAQSVAEDFPEAVLIDPSGKLSVAYGSLALAGLVAYVKFNEARMAALEQSKG